VNEERTRKCLGQVEHICGHLWHRYSITINQVMVATVKFRSFDFNFTKMNPCFSSFLVGNNPLSWISWYEPQALEYRIIWDINTQYADPAGMLLQINGKFTMGKLKSSPLLSSYVLNRPSLSISGCMSRYEADLYVYMVTFISSSMG